MAAAPVIHWFRQDLRLRDNPGLQDAAALAGPGGVIPVFICDQAVLTALSPGRASHWWLHHSLAALAAALEALGSRLILRRGPAEQVLADLVATTGAATITFGHCYEPALSHQEAAVSEMAARYGAVIRPAPGAVLHTPGTILTGSGTPFQVFTPFARACRRAGEPDWPAAPPDHLPAPAAWPASDTLARWDLTPKSPDWAGGLRATWQPGETGALARLDAFAGARVHSYADDRNRPDIAGTSGLSPHLHFGEVSVRTVWHRCLWEAAGELDSPHGRGVAAFLNELLWREFCYHLLYHWPDIPTVSWKPAFQDFPWRDDPAALRAWQAGGTGYPIVDAAMRQLWAIGWMHNRLRMVVASFLVKDLLQPWQAGEAWFRDTLVDADLANNAGGWQWAAGCGADAAPYFRIFNPVRQAQRFDPDGHYTARWVPELAHLPARHIHSPWQAPASALRRAGVTLGETYPEPIVDHATARRRAMAAFRSLRTQQA